jgi:serine/threonine protein kinase
VTRLGRGGVAAWRGCIPFKLFFAGAFGQVYLCKDVRTGGDIAVKTIQRGEQLLLKYVRFEVINHINLRHPNVVDFKVRS